MYTHFLMPIYCKKIEILIVSMIYIKFINLSNNLKIEFIKCH